LSTVLAGEIAIPRRVVENIFLNVGGKSMVFDGASEPDGVIGSSVDNGAVFTRGPQGKRGERTERGKPKVPNPWSYFNGAFSLSGDAFRSASLNIGPGFEAMPEMVEFAFDAASPKGPLIFSGQIFGAEDSPGYLMQLHGQGIFLYDMNARRRAGGIPQQQLLFNGKVKEDARERHIRLFVDRPAGKITTMVDNVLLGHFASKGPAGPRNLGRSILLTTQPGTPCTFSNFWLGPWNGQPPGDASADKAGDAVSLANGDETRGIIQSVDSDTVTLESEVGVIQLPLARVRRLKFGPVPPDESKPGTTRLRFAGYGLLTVSSYHLENDLIVCRSDLAGELKLPLAALREVVFSLPEK